uniref:C2H2-type domain-containing protein n=1 Tax=Pithovirus LCPAC304 TaxID=2506594 RepID=A0A481Z958_9VIRU|nr:MAG: uncharacterized protein LCPAC304_06840 [Pithovirus LCPAC304]
MVVCEVCEAVLSTNSSLNRHVREVHEGDVTRFPCSETGCSFTTKTKRSLKMHLGFVHDIGEVKYYPCSEIGCSYTTKTKGNLKIHLGCVHDVGEVKRYPCSETGCSYTAKIKNHLKMHLRNVHGIGEIKYYPCSETGCSYTAKLKSQLERHLGCVHDVGDITLYPCSETGCFFTTKRKSHLKMHLGCVHDIGHVKQHPCSETDCSYTAKIKGNLKIHLECVHDVGDKVCDYCLGNCFKHCIHQDINAGNVNICRKCYRKVTGFQCRAEEQMVQAIESNTYLSPYIILKDRIVAHDSCDTKRRPDLLLSSGELHMFVECDEHQHRYSNYNPICESGRIDEILDEFKEGKVVFVRWNPDGYTAPNGSKRKKREERLTLLINTIIYLTQNPPSDPISIYYMFYDKDNPIIAKRWKKTFVY